MDFSQLNLPPQAIAELYGTSLIEGTSNRPVEKKIDFKCKKCGHEDQIILSGLSDFFD